MPEDPPKAETADLNRVEWLIANAIVLAAVSANAADCADGEEKELSVAARRRIKNYVAGNTSHMQRDSLILLCPSGAAGE